MAGIPHRFYYVVRDSVHRYRNGDAVAWRFWAVLHAEPGWVQYDLGYCGHDHRDPDRAKACGERMLRRAERGEYPKEFCEKSPSCRHLVRSSGLCVHCERVCDDA